MVNINAAGGQHGGRCHDAACTQNGDAVGIAQDELRIRLNGSADRGRIGAHHAVEDRLLAVALDAEGFAFVDIERLPLHGPA